MAYYLVPVAGDRARAADLLALNGIQNVAGKDGGLVARLAAPDPQKARVRVLASLEGGGFEVGEPSDESEGAPGE
ncbi:MAG: hypothetical protein AUG48_11500 [Actinobacteria bacterium 13_1_20CM_3_68_9]|nr:MAG: hypothetical protein AUG48_11500 [Actinobacteria bacterium 13_1_20CM_3_68_9]